jgi:hypothetical protein
MIGNDPTITYTAINAGTGILLDLFDIITYQTTSEAIIVYSLTCTEFSYSVTTSTVFHICS